MFMYYLKYSCKAVLWHLIAQLICVCFGIGVFLLFTANYRIAEILVGISLTGFYAVYMYSKMYKVGERDTKSYAEEKPYWYKGAVLSVLLLMLNLLLAWLYNASFHAGTILNHLLLYFPFKLWGYSYAGFMLAPDGSISNFYWVLYYLVPFLSCTFGYISGMHRWEIGYHFFKNLVFRKKD